MRTAKITARSLSAHYPRVKTRGFTRAESLRDRAREKQVVNARLLSFAYIPVPRHGVFRSFRIKRFLAVFFLICGLLPFAAFPVETKSFSGMVVDASIYGLVVQNPSNREDVKLFQIHPETQGNRDPHPEDQVRVLYHQDAGGALVADRITITKRYLP